MYLYMLQAGDRVKIVVLRGAEQLELLVLVTQRQHNVDRMADLIDPEKNLVSKLGILGIQIDKKIAHMLPELREASGVIVAARRPAMAGRRTRLLLET